MTKCTLSAEKRASRNKNEPGKVLAAVYGFKTEPISLFVNASEMLRTYRKVGMSSLFDLEIDGKKTEVLVKDIVLHPVQNTIMHVDFFAVNPKKKTSVKVPFHFTGTAPAVKNYGGVFAVAHDSVEVRCLPGDIPDHFDIDISVLEEMGQSIRIADTSIGEKYELTKVAPNVAICSIVGRKVQKAAEETATPEEGVESENTAEEQA